MGDPPSSTLQLTDQLTDFELKVKVAKKKYSCRDGWKDGGVQGKVAANICRAVRWVSQGFTFSIITPPPTPPPLPMIIKTPSITKLLIFLNQQYEPFSGLGRWLDAQEGSPGENHHLANDNDHNVWEAFQRKEMDPPFVKYFHKIMFIFCWGGDTFYIGILFEGRV